MKIYDISWPISTATTGYKDRKVLSLESTRSFEKDGFRETKITIDSHTGTHIDAPAHFLRDAKTIDQLDLSSVIGPCIVIDMSVVSDGIIRDHLENLQINPGDIVLFKTVNSVTQATDKFTPHFIYLQFSGAQYLVERKVRAVGIDYLGIERSQPDHLTHHELFKHNITIIEGLRLQAIKPGKYFLCCLPLNMIGLDAAPARAVLIEGM